MSVELLAPWLGGALAVAGLAIAATRRRELLIRWCFWAVGVPVVVGLFWWGDPGVAILALAAGAIVVHEYGVLLRLGWLDRLVLTAGLYGVVLTTWWEPGQTARAAAIAALVVAVVPVLAGDAAHGLRRVGAGLLGLAWLSPLGSLLPLGDTALALFVAVSVADVAAYFAGPLLGGPRLSPLSPAKRWSGTLVGAAAGVGAIGLMDVWTWQVAVAVAVGGPIGDLFESMVKRGVRTKDSGSWLAGAGGLLDRVDSLLMALALVLVLGGT